MVTTPPITLMATLKDAIRERHARMEALPFITALTAGKLPLESYVGQLRAMAVIHGTLEHELRQLPPSEILTLHQSRPSRLIHLRTDLSALDSLNIPDCLQAVEHVRTIAGKIRRCRMEQPGDLLAFIYLLEGTTLGNAMHLPDVIKTFGDRAAGFTHYYAGYGDKTDEYWQEFRYAMDTLAMDPLGTERLVTVVFQFFDLLESLVAALYPIAGDDKGYTAGMLNPEAGDHAVPDNGAEIQAAVSAARRCREEYPYFDERYQERGRAFAKSDAAWLVTLAQLPQTQLMSQVEWLGRVLGNRGMPRITLERQLELLYEELITADPERREKYLGLLEAAGSFKAERLGRIPEKIFAELTQQFHAATDGELQGRLAKTGELIVAAVCDEVGGVISAVKSLLSWLTDVERFPAEWITEVVKTEKMARKELLR